MKFNKKCTRYIKIDPRKCEACWDCIDECKSNVLGKVDIWFHKHVVVENAEDCCGCRRCISVCPNNVFEPVALEGTSINI
jgi:uncharacterized Fe-S center protein